MERLSAHELLGISNRSKRSNVDQLKSLIYKVGMGAATRGETSVTINFDRYGIHPDMRGYMEGFARQVFPGVLAFRTQVPGSVVVGDGDRLFMDWSCPN